MTVVPERPGATSAAETADESIALTRVFGHRSDRRNAPGDRAHGVERRRSRPDHLRRLRRAVAPEHQSLGNRAALSVGVNSPRARNGHDSRFAPARTAAKVRSRRLSPSSGRAAKGKPPMRPDTKRMDEPCADEPPTVVAGYDRSQESREALHPPTSAQGESDAGSPQRPGPDPASARRVRPPRREAQAELWASTRTSTALSSLIVGTFATGMSAAGRYTVRSGRTVGTYATGQARRRASDQDGRE
jgi:hypothetical protein